MRHALRPESDYHRENLNMGDSGNVVDADDYGRMNFKKVARHG